jgi:hypothetical protein
MGLFGGLFQSIAGFREENEGKKKAKKAEQDMEFWIKNRPDYDVRDEHYQNKGLATQTRNMYSDLTKTGQIPGQQYVEDQLAQNTANTLASAQMYGTTNPAVLSQLAQNALQTQNQQSRNLSIEGARMRQENFGNLASATQALQSANTNIAEEEDKAWNYNVNEPYQLQVDRTRKKLKAGEEQEAKGRDMTNAAFKESADDIGGKIFSAI